MPGGLSFAEFTAYHSLIYKPKETNNVEEYQPDLLPDSFIDGNHENLNYPKIIKLMNSNEKMQYRKVRRVLRNHTLISYPISNIYRFPEKYDHHLLYLIYFMFQSEKKTSWRTFIHIPGEVS